jgi:hypothetical protein
VRNLLETFGRVLQSGRLGEPVFLRCQVTGPPERAVQRLAETLAAATAVIGGLPDRLQACGDPASGCLHAVLVFRSGASVLVTTGPGEEAVDGLLLGNHGAAYGPDGALSRYQEAASLAHSDPAVADRFLTLVHQALSTPGPKAVEAWSDD